MIQVSVLMSVYKEPLAQVRLAVESTMSSLSGIEYQFIIVIDNPDVSREVLEYLSLNDTAQFLVIRNQENLGLAMSLNLALKHVVGDYVLRMDADDICHKDRVKKQLLYMEEHRDVALLGCSMIKIDEEGNEHGCTRSLRGEFDGLSATCPIFFRTLCFHPTWMVRSKILKKYQYFSLITSQDLELQFRLLCDGLLIRNLEEPLHYYRITSSSLSLVGGCRQTLTRLALNKLYGKRRGRKATQEEVANMIDSLDNSALRFLFDCFHGVYTKGILNKNPLYILVSLLFSPLHSIRFYFLLRHKMHERSEFA